MSAHRKNVWALALARWHQWKIEDWSHPYAQMLAEHYYRMMERNCRG